ncbi:hypothetical protein [Actinophytocola glycyrrhizae]|uniref:Trypsin n=1 Tax=Actinophytocola glycyrrhizae TaxID=2044873 RepID=A0ABV9RZH7_9PSEU
MAKEVPGFAGAVADEAKGQLIVHLTEPSSAAATRAYAALRPLVEQLSGSLQPTPTQADYDFLALKAWYDDFAQEVLALPDVVSTDIDEGRNRVHVGVSAPDREAEVRRIADKHSVPQNALIVSDTKPVQPNLQARFRPLQGGQQIGLQNADPALISVCSLGVNVQQGSITGFVTNDHCTRRSGIVDSDLVGQPNLAAANLVGVELRDRALFTSAQDQNCPAGRQCRYSDAALIDALADTPVSVGFVARPPDNNPDWNGTTRYTIDSKGDALAGQTVEKIGRTTGLTRGAVTQTCVHVNAAGTNVTRLCQWLAGYASAGGDSGGPVVAFETGNVRTLRGIHWGGGGGTAVFSPFILVESELGAMRVCAVGTC